MSLYEVNKECDRFERIGDSICIAMWIIMTTLGICLSSCRTQQPIVAVERHDSTRIEDRNHSHYERDKEYIHDSVYIREKGDTVWMERWHDRIIERNVADTIHDSIKVEVHDSVPYPVEVPKYIRQRNGYDKFTAKGFWILLGLIAVAIVIWVGKKRCWWIKPLAWIRKIL